ncbi:CPBP family intramembrane glutamic endopeptidase [Nocardioides mangrovi]|uniref:CPBP family intramembrane metalloprotease n=1 Tax=Nocardioides mangrovi TaxID=2874580 RepID=A0ABS7UFK4_9ACTN|nr:CPBP family intramembrane glutamic endopeptidase [Nocardioides mangrovi]MBZ5739788.1 CPBP family intramembrane metalloprotease [Nocardioides mangrovi]
MTADVAAPTTAGASAPLARRFAVVEIVLVLAVGLGRSAVYAVVSLAAAATAAGGLSSQHAVMNASRAPGRPWLDLTYQLLAIAFSLAPIGLAAYLLVRSGDSLRQRWYGGGRVLEGRDLLRGALLAAGVGSVGIAFYLLTHALGVDATVVASALPDVWWAVPVLVLSALGNALVEEYVVLGFVLVRLRQLGLREPVAIGVAAVLRGSYHLYQGLGGFLGNLAMGVLFGWLYRRWGRLTPLVVTHTLLDVGAFVGYAALAGHVGWLPT